MNFPFGHFDDGHMMGGGGFTSFSSSFDTRGGGGAGVKRTSTSTKYTNGKKITTKKTFENGVETITVLEDDVIKSRSVDGVPQALSY